MGKPWFCARKEVDQGSGSFKRPVLRKPRVPAHFLGGPRTDPGSGHLIRRRHVLVKRRGLARRSAAACQRDDAYDTDRPALRKDQCIARRHGLRWLDDLRSVHAQVPTADHVTRLRTGFEEARLPEPLIGPHPVCGACQDLSLSPIRAAAKGLSGSILSFFGGADEKRPGFSGWPRFGLPLGPLPLGGPPCLRGLLPSRRGRLPTHVKV